MRNLGAAEIVGQFMAARDGYGEWPSPKGETPRLLSTIVLMGMGEPLYNYENVAQAMAIVMDDEGIGLSRRRITLSTSGVVPMMERCGAELGRQPGGLAARRAGRAARRTGAAQPQISDRRTDRGVPPLSRRVQRAPDHVRICHAEGRQRQPADARELVRLIAGIPAKVNLIPFNPWPGSRL